MGFMHTYKISSIFKRGSSGNTMDTSGSELHVEKELNYGVQEKSDPRRIITKGNRSDSSKRRLSRCCSSNKITKRNDSELDFTLTQTKLFRVAIENFELEDSEKQLFDRI